MALNKFPSSFAPNTTFCFLVLSTRILYHLITILLQITMSSSKLLLSPRICYYFLQFRPSFFVFFAITKSLSSFLRSPSLIKRIAHSFGGTAFPLIGEDWQSNVYLELTFLPKYLRNIPFTSFHNC